MFPSILLSISRDIPHISPQFRRLHSLKRCHRPCWPLTIAPPALIRVYPSTQRVDQSDAHTHPLNPNSSSPSAPPGGKWSAVLDTAGGRVLGSLFKQHWRGVFNLTLDMLVRHAWEGECQCPKQPGIFAHDKLKKNQLLVRLKSDGVYTHSHLVNPNWKVERKNRGQPTAPATALTARVGRHYWG